MKLLNYYEITVQDDQFIGDCGNKINNATI